MDYTSIGLDNRGYSNRRLIRGRVFNQNINRDMQNERSPYLNPVAISKGSVTTTLGGVTTIKDTSGSVILFTINPDTGEIIMAGSIIANQVLNLGTVYNSNFTGTLNNLGTLLMGIGTSGTLYNTTLVTPNITDAFVTGTGGTLDNMTMGSPSVVGGVFSNTIINQGTFNSPSFPGTIALDTNVGSYALGANGNFAIQTYGGSAILVCRLGTVTYRFTPSGVI